jgi:protein SCO1
MRGVSSRPREAAWAIVLLLGLTLATAVPAAAHCVATGNDCLKQQAGSVPIFGPFELVDQDGIKVTDKTFAGKPSVIFFGYTSCPGFCPTALSELSTWLNALGPNAYKFNVLFISIDPERDTSAHLKEYLSSFDPRIRGLTGTGVTSCER